MYDINDIKKDFGVNSIYSFDLTKIDTRVSVYHCKECDFADSSEEIFMKHHELHKIPDSEYLEIENILVCSECFGEYKTIDLLKEHMINDHKFVPNENKKKPLKNDDEENVSNENDEIIEPVPFPLLKMRLKQSFIYKCPVKSCSYKFETREQQESHIKCHVSRELNKIRDFKCIQCFMEIKTWRTCTLHMWKQHKIDIDLLKCPVCSYKAITAVKIWHHLKVHNKWRSIVVKKRHPTKEKPETGRNRWYTQKTCEICSRRFANSKTLSKHVKTVHNKIKPFICNVCGTKSARKTTWIIHMRQHTGEKPLQCETCPFRASDPSVLKKHEMKHKQITQYKCKNCDYKSIQSSSFKIHIKIHHPEEYKKLSCDLCNYVCVNSQLLDNHKKDHRKGLIRNEDSSEAIHTIVSKNINKNQRPEKPVGNVEISSDCFLPLESTDSITHDPSMDTGGVTIPAHSEDTQFPTFTTP